MDNAEDSYPGKTGLQRTSDGVSRLQCGNSSAVRLDAEPVLDAVTPAPDLRLREKAVRVREKTIQVREQSVLKREQSATVREHRVASRERVLGVGKTSHKQALEKNAALEKHVIRLRQANEQLVIAAVRAETMAEQIERASEKIGTMAHHDTLTGLPNRVFLMQRLEQAIALARRHHSRVAVLFIDLDRFSVNNDSLGHAVGDQILMSVASRLCETVRMTDTISRHGGDEFVVLLAEVVNGEAVDALAKKITAALARPHIVNDQALHIRVSIGISMFPEDGDHAETLIRNARLAMYVAKQHSGDALHFYQEYLNDRAVRRQTIEAELHLALEQHQFSVYYQPQQDLRSGRIASVEALVRWNHPENGQRAPDEFIGVAEQCGLIDVLGRWVLRESCRQMKAWLDAGLAIDLIAVNISSAEFAQKDFVDNVAEILGETGLPARHLELELTESVLLLDAPAITDMLRQLRALGIKIAIDDFGTGYASFNYLQQFPIDTIKIDQSFISGSDSHGIGRMIVKSVIFLGNALHCQVVAEGVETHEQALFLIENGCPVGQGYFFSQPLLASDCAGLFEAH